jgi:hypothetical protein
MSRAGNLEACIGECTAALHATERYSCAGLRCHLLHCRASAHAAAVHPEEALSDCTAALQLNSAHAECLHLRHTASPALPSYRAIGLRMAAAEQKHARGLWTHG